MRNWIIALVLAAATLSPMKGWAWCATPTRPDLTRIGVELDPIFEAIARRALARH